MKGRTVSLAHHLRESSRTAHTEAESRPFITQLMGGELSTHEYIEYIANLLPVYEELERHTHRGVALPGSEGLWDPALDRAGSLRRDLDALGATRHGRHLVTRAATEYAAHLAGLGGRDDVRLIAHHYTRYLGDLSGGQAIGALVARHYGLSANQLSFCAFPEIDNIVRYKSQYRETLDGLNLTAHDTEVIVAEVDTAFRLNQRLFDSLGHTA